MDKTKDFLKKAKKNLFGSASSKKTSKVDASTQTTLADFNYHATSNNLHFHQHQPSTSTFHETNPFRSAMQSNSTTNRYDLSQNEYQPKYKRYEFQYPTRFVHNSNTRNKNDSKNNSFSTSNTTYNQQKQDHVDYNEAQRIFWNQLQSRMKENK